MGLKFKTTGKFTPTIRKLNNLDRIRVTSILSSVGEMGVSMLSDVTPVDTGQTASSWGFEVGGGRGRYTLSFVNGIVVGGVPLVILLDVGHGTGTGGYVVGRNFIKPAEEEILKVLKKRIEQEVRSA